MHTPFFAKDCVSLAATGRASAANQWSLRQDSFSPAVARNTESALVRRGELKSQADLNYCPVADSISHNVLGTPNPCFPSASPRAGTAVKSQPIRIAGKLGGSYEHRDAAMGTTGVRRFVAASVVAPLELDGLALSADSANCGAATTGTQDRGSLSLHLDLLNRVAVPPAADHSAGAFACSFYTNRRYANA
jgi:hypothetical protein